MTSIAPPADDAGVGDEPAATDAGPGDEPTAPDADRPASVPWGSPTVRIVLAATLLAPLGVPLVSPALPVVRDAFGVSDATASLLISAYFVSGIVLSPIIGALADRVGRKTVLVASLLVFGVAGPLIALAPSFDVVLAIRVLQGTAAAGVFVTTVTIIGDVFDDERRNAVLGANVAVLSAGAAIFPVVGGALVAISWSAPFWAYLLSVPLAAIAWIALEEPARDDGSGESADSDDRNDPKRDAIAANEETIAAEIAPDPGYVRGVVGSIAAPRTLSMFLATFAAECLLFGSILTAMPFLLTGEYGVAPLFVGGVLLLAEAVSIVVAASNGRFARRFTNSGIVAVGFGCLAIGLVAAWAGASVSAFALGAAIIGAGIGLVLPSVDAEVSELVAGRYRAGAFSLRNSTTFLGRAVGPVLFAGLAVSVGYEPLLLASGLLSIVVAGVVFAAGMDRSAEGDRFAPEPHA